MDLKDADFENVDSGEERNLIVQSGYYPARYVSSESREYTFKGRTVEKIIVWWEVFTSPGIERGIVVPRYYNAARNKAKRFKFGRLSDYRKDWVAAHNGRPPLEPNRLPIAIFKQGLFLVEVVRVSRDAKGRPITGLEWSRVNSVFRPLDANEKFERLPVEPFADTG